MFKTVSPVLPVVGMAENLAFWELLGFETVFIDPSAKDGNAYVVIRRDELVLHLQSFTKEQRASMEAIAIRIEMTSRKELEGLYQEWQKLDVITAPLKDQPWGNYEFGFYSPDGCAFFFFVDSA